MWKKCKLKPAREANKSSCTYPWGDIYVLLLWLWWKELVFMDDMVLKTAFFGAVLLDTFKIYKKAYKAY